MVEYGRGVIPTTLGFALSQTVFITQDLITVGKTFAIYGQAMTRNVVSVMREVMGATPPVWGNGVGVMDKQAMMMTKSKSEEL